MAKDAAYYKAAEKIEEARRTGSTTLDLSRREGLNEYYSLTELPEILIDFNEITHLSILNNSLTELPEWICNLTRLQELNLGHNLLTKLPATIGKLRNLRKLMVHKNSLSTLPEQLGNLTKLQRLGFFGNSLSELPANLSSLTRLNVLVLDNNKLTELPLWIGELRNLEELHISANNFTWLPEVFTQLVRLEKINLSNNRLTDIPESFIKLKNLHWLNLKKNPLNPELSAAHEEGIDAVRSYLRLKAADQIILNEAKLILVGEGEVGKTCLMDALEGLPWQTHISTHGIEIRPVDCVDSESSKTITMNGWDFGGQRVYRPTHQLFFSSPAVYLVVWKPREGPQQGFVKEWIQLIKHREPDAKILVVATHGGPNQRQPDIDRQELWDLFGKDTIIDFFHVDSQT